jgi:FkbM family methyltransferase
MFSVEPWLSGAVPEKGDLFIDVGAHRGEWTRELAARFRSGFAVEPNPEILPELRGALPVNVTLCEWAAWDRAGPIRLSYFACRENLSLYAGMGKPLQDLAGPEKESFPVPARPLDSLLPLAGKIDFIKIDTEGSEFQIVLGAEHLIRAHRPRLLIEIHSAENGERITRFLADYAYSLTRIADPEPDPHLVGNPSYPLHRYWLDARASPDGLAARSSPEGPSILVGILAGHGLFNMSERVIAKIAAAPEVGRVWVLTPQNRYQSRTFFAKYPKIEHINSWQGPDSHDFTGLNRERIRAAIFAALGKLPYPVEWIWFGDEDALPADDYFAVLSRMHYAEPVLLTGKTNNLDGRRWYDLCSFQTDGHPFCVPYEDWDNPRWAKGLYASGNQHLFNRAGFALNVPYPSIKGEDPHMCWAFRKAGGKLVFRPELTVTLQKLHAPANLGYPALYPPAIS